MNDYFRNINEDILYVVEYKVKGELFIRKYAYNSKCLDSTEGILYTNTLAGSELILNRQFLEYRIERQMRINEQFE
jgi:hypothetical protein|tara:strand:- start:10543 stop:10770 length:228 start_codon:yes stop_codon:yes gene_type:complete